MILINHAKYIHFYPTFQLPPAFSHCKYKPIHKISQILLISLQILVKMFFSIIICWFTVQFHSISLYSINTFENFLKWVIYINTLQSPCIAWEGTKSCSKFLRNLVTVVHFTDRNWISKSVYWRNVEESTPHSIQNRSGGSDCW